MIALDQLVPSDHLLRKIDRYVNFDSPPLGKITFDVFKTPTSLSPSSPTSFNKPWTKASSTHASNSSMPPTSKPMPIATKTKRRGEKTRAQLPTTTGKRNCRRSKRTRKRRPQTTEKPAQRYHHHYTIHHRSRKRPLSQRRAMMDRRDQDGSNDGLSFADLWKKYIKKETNPEFCSEFVYSLTCHEQAGHCLFALSSPPKQK